jgi:hypothetical protein
LGPAARAVGGAVVAIEPLRYGGGQRRDRRDLAGARVPPTATSAAWVTVAGRVRPTRVRITIAACGGRWDKCVDVLRASVARQCLEAGLLDEILLCVAGVILGDGVRLFDLPGGSCVRLERLSLRRAPLATNAGCPPSAEPSPPAVPS